MRGLKRESECVFEMVAHVPCLLYGPARWRDFLAAQVAQARELGKVKLGKRAVHPFSWNPWRCEMQASPIASREK